MPGFGRTWNWVDEGRAVWSGAHAQFNAVTTAQESACGCLGCAMASKSDAISFIPPIDTDNTMAWSWGGEPSGPSNGQDAPQGPQEVNESGGDVIPGSIGTGYTLALGATETGVINTPGDDDWFAVQLVAGQHYTFTLVGSGGSPLVDPYLQLRGSSGELVHFDDDGGSGLSSLMRFTPATSGTYYVNARAWEDEESGPSLTGGYTLTFTAGTPQNPLTYIDLPYQFPGSTIAVWFAASGEVNSGDTAIRNWTAAEMNAVWSVFSTISAVANINFVAAASNASANFVLSIADLGTNVLGHFFVGVGDGAFDPDGFGWSSSGMAQGSLGYSTITHEILHGLGLGHPHYDPGDEVFMQGVTGAFNSFGTFQLNQGVFTTMSYNDGWFTGPMGNGSNGVTGSQAGPMALDIALLQQLYGANATHNNGSNTYTLAGANGAYLAIWDTGGTDSISYAGSSAVTIDLRPATLQNGFGGGGYVSYVSGIHGGYTIAAGAVIENAVGGSNWDTLTGNDANNRFTGNAGFDTISGGATSASWNRNPDGTWTVIAGADGTDTLTSIEFLDFTDRDVFLDRAASTLTGDGTSDILLRNTLTGALSVWFVQGTNFTSASLGNADNTWSVHGVGDFNGDGRDDLLWRNTGGPLTLWLMNGATVIGGGVIGSADNTWSIQSTGDFNGDGRDDILWRNSGGALTLWFMNGTSATGAVIGAADNSWQVEGIGDLNGDGHDDILWRNSSGAITTWLMNGAASIGGGVVGSADSSWAVQGLGDFNGDGRDDILWRNSSGALTVWFMNGAASVGGGVIGFADSSWQIQSVGDYNGDGRDDILWRNSDDAITVWFMNGTSATGGVLGVVADEVQIMPGGG